MQLLDIIERVASVGFWLRRTATPVPAAILTKDRLSLQAEVVPGKTGYDITPANLPPPVRARLDEAIAAYVKKYGRIEPYGETITVPLLPRRLPEATWKAVRWYMENPPDWRNPKDGEMLNDEELAILQGTLSPDQKMQLKLQYAEAKEREDELKAAEAKKQAARQAVANMCKAAKVPMKDVAAHLAANGIPEITADTAEQAQTLAQAYIAVGAR